jgi:hypothetical protein
MQQKRRNLDEVFSSVRDTRPKGSLYSTAELRNIVETSSIAVSPVRRMATGIKTALALGVVSASIAAGVFFSAQKPADTPQAPIAVQNDAVRQAGIAPTLPEPAQAEVQTHSAVRTGKTQTRGFVVQKMSAQPPTASFDEQPVQPSGTPSPGKIRGLRYVELSDRQLERLGIRRTGGGYELYAEDIVMYNDNETRQCMAVSRNDLKMSVSLSRNGFKEFYASTYGGDTNQPYAVLKHRLALDTFTTNGQVIPYPVASSINTTLSPVIVTHTYYRNTNDQGRMVATFENPLLLDSTSKFNHQVYEMFNVFAPDSVISCRDITKYSLLSKLIPVYIRIGKPKVQGRTNAGSDVLLWYYPTPRFLDALPVDIANRLRIELGFTTLVEEGVLHAEELKKRYCGDYNYMDVCRIKDGAVSITSISPNPATDRAVIKVHVTEQRNFSISLHDMFGNLVAHLSNRHLADSEEIAIDVSDKPAGTYLIAITSDKGEQVVERLIVNH